ncbi:methyl-accepting chemotaxis protein [Labrenzia sp. EL_195]|nr:methyl-accepting chemotaxis protein [Labrenzia sp. EL_195]
MRLSFPSRQGEVTSEISAHALETSRSTDFVAACIEEINASIHQNRTAADNVSNASANLEQKATQLWELVGSFLREVATA